MGTETELKLEARVRDFAWIDELPAVRRYQVGSPSLQNLTTVYFDTPDFALREAEISIRLRDVGGRWVQTVKAQDGAVAGLHRREEWEATVRSRRLHLDRIESKPLRRVIEEHQPRLTPVFTTRFQRRTWDLHFPDGTLIEIAADRGAILVGEESDPISEVEIELRRGDLARLYEVAIALCDERPLAVSSASKAHRAYDLLRPRAAYRAVRAGRFAVTPDMPLEDAFIAVVRRNLECLHANERLLAENASDEDAVRLIRVSARRLLTCLSAFRKWIPEDDTAHLAKDLRWLRRSLADARAWDVFLVEGIDPLLDDANATAVVEPLRHRAEAACRQAYERAQQALLSPRYTKLLLSLGRWIATRSWRIEGRANLAELDAPAAAALRRLLAKRAQRVDRRKRALVSHAPADVGDFRRLIREKRDLYRCFDAALPKPIRRAARPASRLCDAIGALRRLRQIERQLNALEGETDAAALALVRGATIRATAEAGAEVKRRWRAFVTAPPL